ncbi:MAG TPA: hypothetical protein VGF46_03770 [Gaiellales bacterium]|jgi:hypothetical protein
MAQDTTIEQTYSETGGLPVFEIAEGLANGVHTLLPGCTAAVVIAIGPDWQLLAERGPVDVSAAWRATLADEVRANDRASEQADYLVAPFSSVLSHVLLVLVPNEGATLPERAYAIVQPLLDAGGILLDRAIAVQERDQAVRRVVLLCRENGGSASHSTDDLEHSLTLLWHDSSARFYDRSLMAGAGWSTRRIVRTACDLDQPTISRRPVNGGLLDRDLRYQIAIPLPARNGAIVIDVPAAGAELDTRSVAAAITLAHETGRPVHPLLAVAQHA